MGRVYFVPQLAPSQGTLPPREPSPGNPPQGTLPREPSQGTLHFYVKCLLNILLKMPWAGYL